MPNKMHFIIPLLTLTIIIPSSSIQVATYNVWNDDDGQTWRARLALQASFIYSRLHQHTDVLCLQEVRRPIPSSMVFKRDMFADLQQVLHPLGFIHDTFQVASTYKDDMEGVAMFSKTPLVHIKSSSLQDDLNQRVVVAAQIDNTAIIICTHLSYDDVKRQNNLIHLHHFITSLPEQQSLPVIVMGDLNIPGGHAGEEDAPLKEFMTSLDLVDAAAGTSPTAFTYCNCKLNPHESCTLSSRPDRILFSAIPYMSIHYHTISGRDIPGTCPSDHVAVVTEIVAKKPTSTKQYIIK